MRRMVLWLAYSTALCLLISAAACSKATSVYKFVADSSPSTNIDGPDRSGLKKRVLILPFLNQAGISEKRIQELTSRFCSLLEKDPQILLEKTSEPIPSTMKMRSPKFGIIMDADAAKKAEDMAVNALLTVVINPFEVRLKRTGIWPFRSLKREVEGSVIVNGLDLYNGTLFLSHHEMETMSFKAEDLEDEDEEEAPKRPEMPQLDDKAFARFFSGMMQRHASKIRNAMKNLHWTGRILSADGDKIIVSAGKRTGLSKDRVFEVFSRGEQVRSAGGGAIYLLGPKVGELKTVEVMEDFSRAEPVTKAEYKAGQIVRVKRK